VDAIVAVEVRRCGVGRASRARSTADAGRRWQSPRIAAMISIRGAAAGSIASRRGPILAQTPSQTLGFTGQPRLAPTAPDRALPKAPRSSAPHDPQPAALGRVRIWCHPGPTGSDIWRGTGRALAPCGTNRPIPGSLTPSASVRASGRPPPAGSLPPKEGKGSLHPARCQNAATSVLRHHLRQPPPPRAHRQTYRICRGN
jgi:hypothetical protein